MLDVVLQRVRDNSHDIMEIDEWWSGTGSETHVGCVVGPNIIWTQFGHTGVVDVSSESTRTSTDNHLESEEIQTMANAQEKLEQLQ